jgi:hypothetical protein
MDRNEKNTMGRIQRRKINKIEKIGFLTVKIPAFEFRTVSLG